MSSDPKQPYQVGYKKPPVATRFQKGKSGNPGGRSKEALQSVDPGAILAIIDNEEISVLENGKRKRMTRAEIEVRQLFAKAMKGDPRATRLVLNEATKYLKPEDRPLFAYEIIGESEAVERFGANWPEVVADLNIQRGFLP